MSQPRPSFAPVSNGAVLALAVLILFARRPDAFLHPQFWAEDFLFFGDAERYGIKSLVMPIVGYLHLIPRTIAWLSAPWDPLLQPILYTLGSLGVVMVVLLGCLSTRHDLPWKPLLALAVVLVPHSGEVFFNPTNTQWIAALTLLLVACKRDPTTRLQTATDVGTLVFAGLSGPFSIFALPGFALRAWQRRSHSSFVYLGVSAITAAIQLACILILPSFPEFTGEFSSIKLLTIISYRLPFTLYLGVAATTQLGPIVPIGFAVLVLGLFAAASARLRENRLELTFLVLFIATLLVATTFKKRFDLWNFGDLSNGDRYFFIPKVVILWISIILASQSTHQRLRKLLLVLTLAGLVLNLPRFSFAPFKIHPWYSLCPDIRQGKKIEIKINPGWTFRYQRNRHFEGPY